MSKEEELSRLFQAERAEQPLSTAAEHGWQRLSLDLATAVAPMPVAAGPLKLGAWLVPHWILAGFALGVTGVGVVVPALVPSAPSRASDALVHPASHSAAAPATPITSVPPTPELSPSAAAPVARRAPELAALPVTPSAVASNSMPVTFDAELKLISLAKQELDAQRPAQALAWLEDHTQQFPNGVFTTEREALKVLARCAQGPKNQSLAHAFAKLHRGSPLIARLERACATSAAPTPSPTPGASVDFSKLPNEPAAVGEPTSEPSSGVQP